MKIRFENFDSRGWQRFVLGALALCVITSGLLVGQLSNATLTGVVTDPSEAAIPGAVVSATHIATNREFKSDADTNGRYIFLTLPIGRYEISVQANGFKWVK